MNATAVAVETLAKPRRHVRSKPPADVFHVAYKAEKRPISAVSSIARILVVFVAWSAAAASQGKTVPAAHYTLVVGDDADADVAFARRWLDAAEQLMAKKYRVVPERYHISVQLLSRPVDDIDTTQSGQNRCCAIDDQGSRTGTIRFLGPSAPIWKEQALLSSLGLPKNGEDYHAKVLMSEYIPIGHYAAQDTRLTGGWTYYSAPQWFVQGLQEYDGIYHTTETNRTQTAAALMRWARQNEQRFSCCVKGLDLVDSYNGGAAFMAFLAAEFGENMHARLLRNGSRSFDEAFTVETSPFSRMELLERFRRFVRATR
jgi:hypothetical protein